MSDTPAHSDTAVELVAAAIAAARDDDVFIEVEWNGSHWDVLRDAYRADARAALDALAAAGLLLPPGAGARIRRARRRLFARITASAHLLDKPFVDEPSLSPWDLFKREMAAFDEALKAVWAPVPPEPKES